jgi:AcrR family transcriptional regulator
VDIFSRLSSREDPKSFCRDNKLCLEMPFDRGIFLHYDFQMAILERKERDRLKRTDEIMTAAKRLFSQKGFTSTTMQDIADEAKLGRRTLYLYFKTKEEIFFEITKGTTDIILSLVKESENIGDTGLERLNSIASSFIDFYKHNTEEFVFIMNSDLTILNEKGQQEQIKDHRYIIDELCAVLERIIALGIEDGSLLQKEESVSLTAFTMISMIIGTMKSLTLYSGPINPEKENFDYSRILTHSIKILIDSISNKFFGILLDSNI